MPKEPISPAVKKLGDKSVQISKIQTRFLDDLNITYRTQEVSTETKKAYINDVAVYAAMELLKLRPELKEVFPNIEAIINAILASRFSAESNEYDDEPEESSFDVIYNSELILAGLFELAQENQNNEALVKINTESELFTFEVIALLAWKIITINLKRIGIHHDLFGGVESYKLLEEKKD